jgi:hypothetical protein
MAEKSQEGAVHYLPASIFSFLIDNDEKELKHPFRQSYQTVVLFADVSGYTALCEAMAAKGTSRVGLFEQSKHVKFIHTHYSETHHRRALLALIMDTCRCFW